MDIQKEFEKYCVEQTGLPFLPHSKLVAERAWNACAMLMADRVKELEAIVNQRDNEIKTIRAISEGMLKENEKLKESNKEPKVESKPCDNCGEKNNLHYNYDYENKCSVSVLCNECGHITPIDSKEVEK